MTGKSILMAVALVARIGFAYETPVDARYPYVSTYYVQPVVSPMEDTSVAFFVTDWDNSKVRFGDDSHRFSAHLKYSRDGASWTQLDQTDLPSGDHAFNLGKLPSGDYRFGIWVVDERGLSSHTVWHEFRSRTAAELAVPESAVWRVSAQDLADYGIVPETNRYAILQVEASADARTNKNNSVAMIANEMAQAAVSAALSPKTYAVFTPTGDGKPLYHTWKMAAVAYANDYDFAAVEAESAANVERIQRLLDDASARGIVRVVFRPGTYRVSGYATITVPSGLTLDLNDAKIKMNACTGSSGTVFEFVHAHDTHLVNGTVEGDYYEHDYAGSPNNSEWVCGVTLSGDCRYCSLEDLAVRNITGYGVSHGTRGYDHTFPGSASFNGKNVYAPGALRLADGSVDETATNRFTSGYRDISNLVNGYVMVSKYLGYQGIRTKSWYYLAAFYDADMNYLHGEVAFQYRNIPIPPGAKYMRITIEVETADDAAGCELSGQHFKTPWNSAYRRVTIDHCRCVGMATAAMRNFLIEDCDFSYSGDTSATCALDAEDGWDMMQDVWFHRNRFHDNPNNELLTCAGHNFIFEENVAKLHLYARTCSPCVRNNTAPTASFLCDTSRNRTMHGRYENNRFGTSVTFGGSKTDIGWFISSSQDLVSYEPDTELKVTPSVTGRIRDCTVTHAEIFNSVTVFENVTFTNVHFVETQGLNDFSGCVLDDCYLQHHNRTNRYLNCEIRNTNLSIMSGGTMTMTNCVYVNSYFEPSYWSKPIFLDMFGCTVRNDNKFFFRPAAYTVGRINVVDCDFDTGESPAFDIFDLRKNGQAEDLETLPGEVSISYSSCSKGGFLKKGTGSSGSQKPITFTSCCNLGSDGRPVTRTEFLPTLLDGLWTLDMMPSEAWQVGDTAYAFVDAVGVLNFFGKGGAIYWPEELDRDTVKGVVVGNGVTEIGAWLFKDCTSLKSVTVGKDVARFGEEAFHECFSLETIDIGNGKFDLDSIKDAIIYRLTYDAEGKFIMVPSVTVVGCTPMLYGRVSMTEGEWTKIGPLAEQNLEVLKNECIYHFFQTRLERSEEAN